MCQFKSVIVFKDRIYISEENSHTALLEELEIKDNLKNAQTLFVRAESIPYSQDYTLDGIADWRFNVDQDIIPKWFVKNYEKYRVIKALREYFRTDEKLQLSAVKQSGYVLRHIKNPSEAVQMEAVKQDGYAIEVIEDPSEEVQMEAVKQSGYIIEVINNPSELVQMEAVKQNGQALRYIKNPSDAVKLAAVKQDGYVIRFIEYPSQQVVDYLRGELNVSI